MTPPRSRAIALLDDLTGGAMLQSCIAFVDALLAAGVGGGDKTSGSEREVDASDSSTRTVPDGTGTSTAPQRVPDDCGFHPRCDQITGENTTCSLTIGHPGRHMPGEPASPASSSAPAEGRPDREALGRAAYEAWCAADGRAESASRDRDAALARAEAAEGHLRVHEAALNEATDVLDAVKDAVHFDEGRANRVLPEVVSALVLRRDNAEARVTGLEIERDVLDARVNQLETALRVIRAWDMLNPSGDVEHFADAPWLRREIDAALRPTAPTADDGDEKEKTT